MTLSKFEQNTGSEKGTNNNHDGNVTLGKYVDFTFTPSGGNFIPTNVSFDIVKNATGDPTCDVDLIDGDGNTISVASNSTIVRNNDTASSAHSYSVSSAASSSGAVTLRIIVGKLASGKSVSIANVVIEGTLVSADAPVLSVDATKSFKVIPYTPNLSVTKTITLTGKNLQDGIYYPTLPVPMVDGLSISPESFSVTDGEVNQEFSVTYAPTSSTDSWIDGDITFVVGGQTATTDCAYYARLEAYEQNVVSEAASWNWEGLTETVSLTKVEESVLLAGNGFIIAAEPGNYAFAVTEDTPDIVYPDNELTATGDAGWNASDGIYVLAEESGKAVMAPIDAESISLIPANKAFLYGNDYVAAKTFVINGATAPPQPPPPISPVLRGRAPLKGREMSPGGATILTKGCTMRCIPLSCPFLCNDIAEK